MPANLFTFFITCAVTLALHVTETLDQAWRSNVTVIADDFVTYRPRGESLHIVLYSGVNKAGFGQMKEN